MRVHGWELLSGAVFSTWGCPCRKKEHSHRFFPGKSVVEAPPRKVFSVGGRVILLYRTGGFFPPIAKRKAVQCMKKKILWSCQETPFFREVSLCMRERIVPGMPGGGCQSLVGRYQARQAEAKYLADRDGSWVS